MKITEGTIITFTADDGTQQSGKIVAVNETGEYVVHNKTGAEFEVDVENVIQIGEAQTPRSLRKAAQKALQGKPGLSDAQKRQSIVTALQHLEEALQIIDNTVVVGDVEENFTDTVVPEDGNLSLLG